MLHAALATVLAVTSSAALEFRPLVPALENAAPAPASVTEVTCDDGTTGGTFVQRGDAYYGNRFTVPCGTGALTAVRFAYFGNGLAGPYAFRLRLFDGLCREIGSTEVIEIPGAPSSPAVAEIDLASRNWCVAGSFALLLEPLTCADGAAGHDCFPALVVDATSDPDGTRHCAIVGSLGPEGRECLQARSADGRAFDFRLRADVACLHPACTTGVRSGTWSDLKQLYRDPSPGSRD